MKKIAVLSLIFVIAALPIVMALSTTGVQAVNDSLKLETETVDLQWHTETVDITPPPNLGWYVGRHTSIALDSENKPHISYVRKSVVGTVAYLEYARWTGSEWLKERVDDSGDVGGYTSIALDSDDKPHISYYGDNALKYAKKPGFNWDIDTVDDPFFGRAGMYSSIDLDSSNRPHISYQRLNSLSNNYELKYAKWTGTTWDKTTVDSTDDTGYDTSIALDSSDNPHISYYDGENLRYAKWTGTIWDKTTVDYGGFWGGTGMYTSIALDSLDRAHISYYDNNDWELRYAKWTGTIWDKTTVDPGNRPLWSTGTYTSIALDSLDRPYISYLGGGTNGGLKFARWTGTTWDIDTVDSTSILVGMYTSIALDSWGNPHISYYDDTNSALKYATANVFDFSVSISPSSQTVVAGDSTSHTVTLTRLDGKPGSVSLSLDLPPSVGVYTLTPQSGTPTFTSTLTITTRNTALPGTYTLIVTATGMGITRTTSLTLTVTVPPKLTLNLNPLIVSRGSSLTISGQLTPGKVTSIRLYYRFPHETGSWSLGTTLTTDAAGAYSRTVTVPMWAPTGTVDEVAVWFDEATGAYTASPIVVLTIVPTAHSTATAQAPPGWIETVDSAWNVGEYSSVALDSLGRPHISYYDRTNGNLKYVKWTGTTWSVPQVVDSAGDVGKWSSIALDSWGKPHISYYYKSAGNLKYARWTGTTWDTMTVDWVDNVGRHTSIALDSLDRPHISYYDYTNEALKYVRWYGTTWGGGMTVDSPTFGSAGKWSSIALDSLDRPHISYLYSDLFGDGDLKYAKLTFPTWDKTTVDSTANTGYYTSLAFDPWDRQSISYYDKSNGNLKIARWTGSTWSPQVVDSAGDVGLYTSLALDSGGKPQISYYASSPYYDLKYAEWTGTAWSRTTVDSAGSVGMWSSLALDANDNGIISYYDSVWGALKVARPVYLSWFRVSVSPLSQTVVAGGSTSHTVTVTRLFGSGSVSLTLSHPIVGGYSFNPQSGTPTFTSTLTITTLNTAPPGTYDIALTATGNGLTIIVPVILTVTAPPKLTLNFSPQVVSVGSSLTISGQLTPGQATSIRLYYRFPHETGSWSLGTTMTTDAAGAYSITPTIPMTAPLGDIDLVAVWFNETTGTYTASPIVLLTIT